MSRVRSALLAFLSLLYVASFRGVPLRPLVLELAASPLPGDVGARDGVLDVFVLDETSKAPLPGARVRAFAMIDGRAHDAGTAKADASGLATLRALPHAEHWVVAEADGHARASQMVVVVPGPRKLTLQLGAEHRLDVEVKSEAGAPLPGAEVEVLGGGVFPVGALTGDDGLAHVAQLSEPPYVVRVRAPGFEEVTRHHVGEGERLVVTLGKQGALLVKVTGAEGRPEAGARVLVASPSLWPARSAETGPDGAVRIGGLDSGTYAVRAVKGSWVSPIDLGVSLARGDDEEVVLALAPGVMVTAHVISASSDDDVRGARVTLAEAGLSPFPVSGVTDKDGRVVLGPVARGPSTLSARADGFVDRGAVRVGDPPPKEVTIALLRGGALVGRVVDARGYAVDGATIRVVGTDLDGMPIDEDPTRAPFRAAHFAAALAGPVPLIPAGDLGVMPGPVPAIPHGPLAGIALVPRGGGAPADPKPSGEPWVTARDGTFRAEPIPPGRVRAIVRHPQYVEAMSEVVTLASDKEAKVEVVLSRGGDLEGRVVDTKGDAVEGARVTVLATRGSLERATDTASDGSFAFAALPPSVTVLVSRGDASSTAARVETTVPEAGKRTIEIVLPDAREPLPVTVTGDRDEPVDAAQVSATSLDPAESLRVTAFTNARGEAALASAMGLPLRVEVHAPGRATKVIVTTAEMKALAVVLATGERVTGEVWANRRETVEGASVVLQTDTGTRRARTNADGAFTIRDVPAGPARLRIRAKGRVPLVRDVRVEANGGERATELGKLEMREAGVVEGVVIDERGDPVPGARVGEGTVPTYLPVAKMPEGIAVCDAQGRFRLEELAEGTVTLEAYAPDFGRARKGGIRVLAGRTTDGVRITLARRDEATSHEPAATGGVAITLGQTAAGLDEAEVVVAAVSEGSEAERAGLAQGDVLLSVGGEPVRTMVAARARLSGPVHDDVLVKVRRGERTLTLRVAREPVRR